MASESVPLPDEMSEALARMAATTGRSKSVLMVDAIHDYIEREAWIIADLQKALAEEDAGEFATQEEMDTLYRKWVTDAS